MFIDLVARVRTLAPQERNVPNDQTFRSLETRCSQRRQLVAQSDGMFFQGLQSALFELLFIGGFTLLNEGGAMFKQGVIDACDFVGSGRYRFATARAGADAPKESTQGG